MTIHVYEVDNDIPYEVDNMSALRQLLATIKVAYYKLFE